MRLSEQEVSQRRARLAVATTQARALAREVHRLRAEILSGEASDDSPDPRQLELPEVSPTPTPALAQAEPARLPTLLERLTLAEPVRCLLTPVERALSPGALALYRELYSLRETGDRRHVPSGGVLVEGLDLELVYELLAYSLVTAVLDVSGQLVALSPSLIPEVVVDEPTDGEALEQLAQELEEAGTVAQLRDTVRLPTVVVRAGLRALEQMGAVELDGDRYWRQEAGADYQLARRLERQLDAALAAHRQPSLFGGDVLCAQLQRCSPSVVSEPGPWDSCRPSARTALCMGLGAWAASTSTPRPAVISRR